MKQAFAFRRGQISLSRIRCSAGAMNRRTGSVLMSRYLARSFSIPASSPAGQRNRSADSNVGFSLVDEAAASSAPGKANGFSWQRAIFSSAIAIVGSVLIWFSTALLICVVVIGIVDPLKACGLDIVAKAKGCTPTNVDLVPVLKKSQEIDVLRGPATTCPHVAQYAEPCGRIAIEPYAPFVVLTRFNGEVPKRVPLFAIGRKCRHNFDKAIGKRGSLGDCQIAFRDVRFTLASVCYAQLNTPVNVVLNLTRSSYLNNYSTDHGNATNDEFRSDGSGP